MAQDTSPQTSASVVQRVYEGFSRGDVPAILSLCAPDMTWEVVGQPGGYPLWRTFKGAEGGVAFFTAIAANEDFSDFSVREIIDAGDLVTVLGHAAYKIRSTGRSVDTDFVHLFRVEAGKIVSFREFSDTAQVAAAYRD